MVVAVKHLLSALTNTPSIEGSVSTAREPSSFVLLFVSDESSRGRPRTARLFGTYRNVHRQGLGVSCSGRLSSCWGVDRVAIYGVGYWGSQSTPQSMAPKTHTRYRVQRPHPSRRMAGAQRSCTDRLAADVISEAHDTLIDPPRRHCLFQCGRDHGAQQLQAVMSLNKSVVQAT